MKKLIYAGIALITFSLAFVSCRKKASYAIFTSETQMINPERNLGMSDADLIAAINGSTPDYLNISDLEELLLDNARLSANVIHALIAEIRVPNYIVETSLVTSAPVSSTELAYLETKRPEISPAAIIVAAAANPTAGFFIVNTSPRQVIFGTGIRRTSGCNCGDGEIKISDNHLHVNLTESTPDPAEVKPCRSDNGKWYCGTPRSVTQTGTDGTNVTYESKCAQSTEKCVRKPRDARYNNY